MPDERFTWKKQREGERKPPTFPGWQPEFVAERYRRLVKPSEGWQPTSVAQPSSGFEPLAPQLAPLTQAMLAQRRGEEQFDKVNLIKQINYLQTDLGIPEHRKRDFTEDDSIDEIKNYLELLQQSYDTQWRGQREFGAKLPRNVESVINQAESLGIDTSEFEEGYAKAPTEMARGLMLVGFNQEVNTAFQSRQAQESRVLAREFPEEFGAYAEKMRSQYRGVGRFAPPEETFYGYMAGKPELQREQQTRQYQEFPQLYPWYQEAGGRGTGKTFQEWIPTEPLARAYLGEKRKQEAIPRETRRAKWQPARR